MYLCACVDTSTTTTTAATPDVLASSSVNNTMDSKSVVSPPVVVEKKGSPGQVRLPVNTAPKCSVCQKTVYKMEEVSAVGRIWHSNCFTCGGGKADTEGIL